jgi:PhzF family phenazine biosynthesis protein
MQVKTYIIDAFTREAFKGNPAGVCLLEESLPEHQMQAIAAELNLSETAFLLPRSGHPLTYDIRYFTPTTEIAFCGHATLASAKLVLDRLHQEQVTFVTQQELTLHAAKEADSILMQFPLYGYQLQTPMPVVNEALGISAALPLYFSEDIQMLLLEVPDKQTLLQLRPDFGHLVRLINSANGLAVTTKSEDPEFDFYSRCFWPWVGINEDPVTGSAHSVLAAFWAERLQKTELRAGQLSQRGGYLDLRIKNESTLEVRSQAQIVLEGVLHIE